MISSFLQDIRYGIRQLRKAPAFSPHSRHR